MKSSSIFFPCRIYCKSRSLCGKQMRMLCAVCFFFRRDTASENNRFSYIDQIFDLCLVLSHNEISTVAPLSLSRGASFDKHWDMWYPSETWRLPNCMLSTNMVISSFARFLLPRPKFKAHFLKMTVSFHSFNQMSTSEAPSDSIFFSLVLDLVFLEGFSNFPIWTIKIKAKFTFSQKFKNEVRYLKSLLLSPK